MSNHRIQLHKHTLGELLDVTRGMSLPGTNYATSGELIRLTLGNFDYGGNGFKENTSKDNIYYSGKVPEEYIMEAGDIITPLTEQTPGLLGTTARIPESGKYIQSQDVALITCKPDKLDPLFCYYLVSSSIVKQQLAAGSQQTKIRHTSPDKIKACVVYIPEDLTIQHKIGDFLSSIDEKISLNRKANAELEALAKQIYDYWFVQFDFPDENGRPYKSSGGTMVWNSQLKREIPACLEPIKAKDICKVLTGKEDANFSTVGGAYPFFTCSKEVLKCDTPSFNGSAVLIAGNGDFNVKHYSGEFNAYQRTYVLIPSSNYFACLYLAANNRINQFKDKSNGSIVKFITKGDVEDIELFQSKDSYLYVTLNQIIFKIEQGQRETQQLITIRDRLFPLLMNGQVAIA